MTSLKNIMTLEKYIIFVDRYQKSFYSGDRWGVCQRHPENYFWRKR
jgi:hypothetical protein